MDLIFWQHYIIMWSVIRWHCCRYFSNHHRQNFCMNFWFFWESIWQELPSADMLFIIKIQNRLYSWDLWFMFLPDGRFMQPWNIRTFRIRWSICHLYWWELIKYIKKKNHIFLSGQSHWQVCRIFTSFTCLESLWCSMQQFDILNSLRIVP